MFLLILIKKWWLLTPPNQTSPGTNHEVCSMLVNRVSIDNSIPDSSTNTLIRFLTVFLVSTCSKKINQSSTIPINLSCQICVKTSNSHKSRTFRSIDSLLRHISKAHKIEPKLHCGQKESYTKFLHYFSIILETLYESVGKDYEFFLKTPLLETVSRGFFK